MLCIGVGMELGGTGWSVSLGRGGVSYANELGRDAEMLTSWKRGRQRQDGGISSGQVWRRWGPGRVSVV